MEPPANAPPTLPLAARRYIGAVGGGGAVAAVIAVVMLTDASLDLYWSTIAVLVLLGAGSIVAPLRFHHNGAVQGFNLTIATFLSLLVLLPDAAAVVAVGVASFLGYGIGTRSFVKTLYNAGQDVLWATLASWAAGAVAGGDVAGDVLTAPVAVPMVVAAVVAVVVNVLLAMELFHLLRGESRIVLLRDVVGAVTFVALAGNSLAALVLILLAERSPVAVLMATPLFAGLLVGYRGVAREHQQAGQAARLQQTSSQLLDAAVDEAALGIAVEGLRDLFSAEHAVLDTGDTQLNPELRSVLRNVRRDGTPVLRTEAGGLMAVPVVLDGLVVATLAVTGRHGLEAWDHTDLALMATIAGEIAATLRTRSLLEELQRERSRLAAESRKLGDILTSASDGIVLLDAEGVVVECNPAMAALAGRRRGEVLGRGWDEVFTLRTEDDQVVARHGDSRLASALRGGKPLAAATFTLERPDEQLRWLRCSVAPVDGDQGVSSGAVLVAVDLTREREIEELRSDFLATVSHELRTPLTPLAGFLAVMKLHGDTLDDERRTTMVDAMEKQVERLQDLIGDLLHVADVERYTTELAQEPVDVAASVSSVVEIEANAPEHHRRVLVDAEPATALGSESAIRRVARALVTNGLKHTDGLVVVRVHAVGDTVVVDVDDEGEGVAEWAKDVIFEPFRRLGNHLHRTQGPGLGLSIARSLAEGMGGTLTVESLPDGGARFRFSMPAASSDVRRQEPSSSQ